MNVAATQRISAGTTIAGGTNRARPAHDRHLRCAGKARRQGHGRPGWSPRPARLPANASVIFVPLAFAKGAPSRPSRRDDRPHHRGYFQARLSSLSGALRAPDRPELPTPGQANLGISPADITGTGPPGLRLQVGHADLPAHVTAAWTSSHRRGLASVRAPPTPMRWRLFEVIPGYDVIMIGEIGRRREERVWPRDPGDEPVVAHIVFTGA